jgi:SAM-dependent methyltransferase
MNWRLKAQLQNLIAAFPSDFSYELYFFLQRHFGGLRTVNPISRFQAGIAVMERLRRQQLQTKDKAFLEVGTGRCVDLPIALWLCGAGRVITVDLNPYLAPDLIRQSLTFVRNNRALVEATFGDYAGQPWFAGRLELLLSNETSDIRTLLTALNIEYLAPVDATGLALQDKSVDYHVSFAVLEHIPPSTLCGILKEGRRLLRSGGRFIHLVDFSDHFSHSDDSITAVNFLRFSEKQWARCAGNRYMYHNRMRVDEFTELLAESGLSIDLLKTSVDQRALEALQKGFPLAERFQRKPPEVNAVSSAWVVAAAP